METITMKVHQGLAELKMLDKKIRDQMNSAVFGYYKLVKADTIRGKKVADISDAMAQDYQSINDHMARYNAIKQAIVISNATTKLTVGDTEYTVAEAIELKNHFMPMMRDLRDTMLKQYNAVSTAVEDNNTRVRAQAERNAREVIKPDGDNKIDPEVFEKLIDVSLQNGIQECVWPTGIDVSAEIAKMTDKIDTFLTNVDAALSISNAITDITVTY